LSVLRSFRLIFAILLLLAAGLHAQSASNSVDADHVRVELLVPGNDLYPSDKLNDVGIYFKLEPGWHIYWKNPGDAGLPTQVSWTLPRGITAGPMQFPAPKRLPLGPLMDFGYEKEVLFPLKLHVANSVKGGSVTLHAKVDWLVCRERCIPGKAELEVQRSVWGGMYEIPYYPRTLDSLFLGRTSRSLPKIPKPLPASVKAIFQTTPAGFRLTVETGQRETSATFFPSDQDILDNPAPQKLTPTANGLILDLKKDSNFTAHLVRLNGVLELSGGRAFEISALPLGVTMPATGPGSSAPVAAPLATSSAPVHVSTLASPASNPAPPLSWLLLVRISGLAFLGGLLLNLMPCVLPVLFIKGLALVNSGNEERRTLRVHGLVYTAGILVSFWTLVAALLGLRAAGSTLGWGFQFQSPVFLSLMAGLLFFMALSLAGQFEIGLRLTSAGGSLAAKQGLAGSFFTGVLAVVVATPCTAPFMGAAVGYALTQSAAVTFVVFTALALGLAAPYVALTLQPAWTRLLPKPGAWMEILRQAISVPLFATVIWLAWVLARAYGASVLALLLTSFLLLAIAGWFLGRWPARRWSSSIAALLLLGVVGLAVLGQKLASETNVNSAEGASAQPSNSGAWEPWSPERLAAYQAQGRPVFVDFTASWCLTCQVNERAVLSQAGVQHAFADHNVALLRADWTRHDEAITRALTALGRSGVPAYALYAPGNATPQLLPEVLTPGIVTDAVAKLPKMTR
jgi:thiol:disulfide interchange protein/DsbC/DsbD-like thiol-disulfide interchange protein